MLMDGIIPNGDEKGWKLIKQHQHLVLFKVFGDILYLLAMLSSFCSQITPNECPAAQVVWGHSQVLQLDNSHCCKMSRLGGVDPSRYGGVRRAGSPENNS